MSKRKISKITLSMVLSAVTTLNLSTGLVPAKNSENVIDETKATVSQKNTSSTTANMSQKAVEKPSKSEVVGSKATETSIYDFKYTTSEEENTVKITGYIGSDTEIVIPEDFNGYEVTEIGSSAFNGKKITSITLPSTVKKISDSAFANCSSLTQISLGSSLQEIGSYAFYYCNKLTSITIPNSCTTIKNDAFQHCYALATVNFGKGLKTIENYAFYDCRVLDNIEFPNTLESIGYEAFMYCYKLSEVNIPDSVTSMGTYCFQSCSSISKVTIGKGLKNIPDYAFWSNSSLKEVTLSDSVEVIGNSAFRTCSKLETINWGSGVKTLGNGCFNYCSSLKEISIPDSVTTISNESLANCSSLTTVNIGKSLSNFDANTITSSANISAINVSSQNPYFKSVGGVLYTKDMTTLLRVGRGYEGSYTIPASVTKINEYAFSYCQKLTGVVSNGKITSIGKNAFDNCTLIKSLAFSDTLTNIDNYAFNSCSKLEAISLGNSLQQIGNYSFRYCSALKSITLPNTLTKIGEYAFANCGSIDSVVLPDSLTSIGNYAFQHCSSIKSVTFGKAMTTTGYSTFSHCTGIESIKFSPSIKTIGGSAFYGCNKITSLEIPGTVEEIGSYSFYSCSNLSALTLRKGIIKISDYAFSYCSSLTSVSIPATVTTIGNNAFNNCQALTSVYLGDAVTSFPISAFDNDKKLERISVSANNPNFASKNGVVYDKDITKLIYFPRGKAGAFTVPETVTAIGDSALNNCVELTSVTVNDNTTTIGSYAFNGCTKLETVKMGKNFTTMGDYAFSSCTALKSIDLGESLTNISGHGFYGCSSLESIKFPSTVTSMSSYCFQNCSKLTKVEMNENLTNIGYEAFWYCSALNNVVVPSTVRTIESWAFERCTALENITLKEGLEQINSSAFSYSGVKNIVIPDSVVRIDSAFPSANALESITLGSGLTSFTPNNNLNQSTLKEINVSSKNTVFASRDGVLYSKDMTRLIRCPASHEGDVIISGLTETLEANAFNGCSKLTSISEYGSVISAGSSAISGLSKSTFTAFVTENSFLHKSFSNAGYTCKAVKDTRPQVSNMTITYNKYIKYTGSHTTANLKLVNPQTEEVLVKDVDYRAEYINDINAGTATINIYGKGEYGGNTSISYTIYYNIDSTFEAIRKGPANYVLTVTPKNGVPDYTYKYEFIESSLANDEDAQWTLIDNPENLNNVPYFFEEDGNFVVRTTVTDILGNTSVKTQNVEVVAPRAKLLPSISEPNLGDKVTFTGSGNNFAKNRQYKFEYQKNGGEWQTIRDFSAVERTVDFSFNEVGEYKFKLTVKDDSNNIADCVLNYKIVMPVVNIDLSKNPILNEAFNINVALDKYSGSYKYKYEYKVSGENTWKMISDYSYDESKSMKFDTVGNYVIRVTAKSVNNSSIVVSNTQYVVVRKPIIALTVPTTASKGSNAEVAVKPSYFGEQVTYKYEYKNSGSNVWTEFDNGSKANSSLVLKKSGDCTVRVTATDQNGNKFAVSKIINVSSNLEVTLNADYPRAYVGENITFTANSKLIDDEDEYQYKFEYRELISSTWHTVQDYSDKNTFVFLARPCAVSDNYSQYAGAYEMRVTVKDSSGETSTAKTTVTPKKMELSLNLSQENVKPDTEVTLTANSRGGVGSVKYMYVFKKDNGSWQPLGYTNYTDKNIVKFKFSAEGTYTISVAVKDSEGYTIGNVSGASGVGYESITKTLVVKTPEEEKPHALEGSINIDNTTIGVNKTCSVTASSKYAKGTPLYRFTVRDMSETTEKELKAYSTSNSLSFSANKEGTYCITSYVKDDSGVVVSSQKYVYVKSYNLSLKLGNTYNKEITFGQKLEITPTVYSYIDTTYAYKYEYKLKNDTEWTLLCNYTSIASKKIVLPSVGSYDIKITARSSTGIIKTITDSVYVNQKLKVTASALPTHIAVGTGTVILCNTTDGTGPSSSIKYKYEYCPLGTEDWLEFNNGTNNSVAMFSSDTADTYRVRITATDVTGATSSTAMRIYCN